MGKNIIKKIFFIAIIFLSIDPTFTIINAKYTILKNPTIPIYFEQPESPDIIVFISPQYKNDIEITTAIQNYLKTIKNEIGWNSIIIKIQPKNNDYKQIDQIIEQFYLNKNLKACIMVGEDIHTALSGDSNYMEKPSTVPWFTVGGNKSYEISQQGIISKPYKINICISLLYPTSELDYNTKKQQIISVFEKFTNNREKEYLTNTTVFESTDLNINSKEIYKTIQTFTNLNYKENPTTNDIEELLKNYNSMIYIHGHSNPSGTLINQNENIWFSAEILDNIKTPFFGADGCYVSGWWSNQKDNNKLDNSIIGTWYGSKIFTSKHIKVMALGLLSQNGYTDNVSFIQNVIPGLLKGETLAESMIGTYTTGDVNIFGDPTFHFMN